MTVSPEESQNEKVFGRGKRVAQGVGAFLGRLKQTSSERAQRLQEAYDSEIHARFESVHRQAEGMNMTAMTILQHAAEIPNQNPTNVLKGYEWKEDATKPETSQRWVLELGFGKVAPKKAHAYQTPLLIENIAKPRFVLDGMTTEIDTAGFIVDAPLLNDGSYGAPRTELVFNASTRESDGREFTDGVLDGTSNPTGAVRAVLDEHGQITEVWVSRNNKTGMSQEPVRPELLSGLPGTLTAVLAAVDSTASAYQQLNDHLNDSV